MSPDERPCAEMLLEYMMFDQKLTEESRREQLHRWNSLTQGAIFESSFSVLYLVTAKTGTQATVIPLSAQNRSNMIAGDARMELQQLGFGDVNILRVYPMPSSNEDLVTDLLFKACRSDLRALFETQIPDPDVGG